MRKTLKYFPLLVHICVSFLDHLVLVVGYVSGQTAGQEHSNELEECDSKGDASDDSQISFHFSGHHRETALLVHLCRGLFEIFEALRAAVLDLTAAGWDAVLFEIGRTIPVRVCIDATATQSTLNGVQGVVVAVGGVVLFHSGGKGLVQYVFELVPKDES